MAKDQVHEQSTKPSIQEHGGAVGLYENPYAPMMFMLEEFERVYKQTGNSTAHNKEEYSLQVKF